MHTIVLIAIFHCFLEENAQFHSPTSTPQGGGEGTSSTTGGREDLLNDKVCNTNLPTWGGCC